MAQSKFEYVKSYETVDKCLPNTWIVVRVDGKGFHKFSNVHKFKKPNDPAALDLMKCCAERVMDEFKEISVAYGQSDEFSFVFKKKTDLFKRRASKIMTYACSLFSSSYVYYWKDFFPTTELSYPPAFDARVVLYPSNENLRDYLSWRQADCHINNLYNTTFWALVLKGGLTPKEAEEKIRHTLAKDKNEILFSSFGVNYNNEPEVFRKGTTIFRKRVKQNVETSGEMPRQFTRMMSKMISINSDIIGDEFWNENEHLLTS